MHKQLQMSILTFEGFPTTFKTSMNVYLIYFVIKLYNTCIKVASKMLSSTYIIKFLSTQLIALTCTVPRNIISPFGLYVRDKDCSNYQNIPLCAYIVEYSNVAFNIQRLKPSKVCMNPVCTFVYTLIYSIVN